MSEPTFEDLQAKAAREWAERQKYVGAQINERAQLLAKSPDVLMHPSPDEPWSAEGVECAACKGPSFFCVRHVTVSGKRYRCEVTCTTCGARNTFDWATKSWLE